MNINPLGPEPLGPQENLLTPPPQLGESLKRLQDPQVQQSLSPILQIHHKNTVLLSQMMQILSTLMGNQDLTLSTSVDTYLGNFSQHSTAWDESSSEMPPNPLAQELARAAENNAQTVNTPGRALPEITKVLRQLSLKLENYDCCFQLVGGLRSNKILKEVQVARAFLPLLPPGAIVVWDQSANFPSGHVSIALGDCREASSIIETQQILNANHWTFYPR